jgi:hypothetical protein
VVHQGSNGLAHAIDRRHGRLLCSHAGAEQHPSENKPNTPTSTHLVRSHAYSSTFLRECYSRSGQMERSLLKVRRFFRLSLLFSWCGARKYANVVGHASRGHAGAGGVTRTSFSILLSSIDFWEERLQASNILVERTGRRFEEEVLTCPSGRHEG